MIRFQIIGKIWTNVPIQYFEIYNQKISVNVPIQYFEIYNQYRYNFLYSNSWFVVELTNLTLSRVLPRPAMSTTALVLNWKWLPLFQFLICTETLPLVLNWKWLGFKSMEKFEELYPLNTLKFTIRKFEWMYPLNILKFTISMGTNSSIPIPDLYCQGLPVSTTALVLNWKWLPLFQFLICSRHSCPGVELKTIGLQIIGKIWVNVPIQYFEIYNQCGYNFLYSNSWFVVELTNLPLSRVLPRPAMSTTALVLNWKWLPLFQFLICSEILALVLILGNDWPSNHWENLSECTHSIFWNLQ